MLARCWGADRGVRVCVDVEPIVAGKPYPPLLQETIKRMRAVRPVFVGDRLDTDIEGANNVDIDSFLVFTGAHGKWELATRDPSAASHRDRHDLRGLLQPRRRQLAEGTVITVAAAARLRPLTASSGQVAPAPSS